MSPRIRLDSVIEKVRAIPMGGTDRALPLAWARRNKLRVSAFVTYTDSETWAGNIHLAQALPHCQFGWCEFHLCVFWLNWRQYRASAPAASSRNNAPEQPFRPVG
jgi:hypothetical protein